MFIVRVTCGEWMPRVICGVGECPWCASGCRKWCVVIVCNAYMRILLLLVTTVGHDVPPKLILLFSGVILFDMVSFSGGECFAKCDEFVRCGEYNLNSPKCRYS